eukprot:4669101-Amphidinium_carterae.1
MFFRITQDVLSWHPEVEVYVVAMIVASSAKVELDVVRVVVLGFLLLQNVCHVEELVVGEVKVVVSVLDVVVDAGAVVVDSVVEVDVLCVLRVLHFFPFFLSPWVSSHSSSSWVSSLAGSLAGSFLSPWVSSLFRSSRVSSLAGASSDTEVLTVAEFVEVKWWTLEAIFVKIKFNREADSVDVLVVDAVEKVLNVLDAVVVVANLL